MASRPPDDLVDELVAGLRPVRRRSTARDLALLALIGVAQVVLYLAVRGMRPDMHEAMALPAFWWKAVSLAVLVAVAGGAALGSLDPAMSPRRGLRWVGVVVAAVIGLGWALDAASGGATALLARLNPGEGLRCVGAVVILSLPALAALGLLMRRGAPTDPRGTATAIGLTAAAWGGFVFVLNCPHDDPLYVAVWYAVGMGAVALAARFVLPQFTRW